MDFEGVLRDVMDKRGFAEAFYDEIRLVDPVSKAVLSHLGKGGEPADTGKRCYEFFDKPIACEHCISMLALQRNGQVVKIDCGLPRVYVTTAEPVEHEGGRFVVETLKNISDSGLVSIQGEEAVAMNKLLERRNSMLLKDALTKIYRENLIDLRLPQDLYQVKAGNRTLSLILVSIQNLKEINETQGLDAGDELLRQSAAVLNGFAGKPGDWVARFAGSEMLLALFDLDEEKTRRVCARVRSGLRRMLLADGAPALKAVFSIGYHLPDGETADPNRLIAAARGNVFRPLSGPNLQLDSTLLQKAFPHMRLSTREAEAAALLLHGKSNQKIAKAMYVSLPTVKKHIAKVLEEASVKSRSEFIARGLR